MPNKTIHGNIAGEGNGDKNRREAIGNLTFENYQLWMKRFENDFRLFNLAVPTFENVKKFKYQTSLDGN